MFYFSGKRGYTLIEVIVAASVMALISMGLFTVMEGHMGNFRAGSHHIRIQHELQRIIKQIFTDFKKINTPLIVDEKYNIWFNGENKDNMKLNRITLKDMDLDRTNGYEGLEFSVNLIEPLGKKEFYYYGMEKDDLGAFGLYRSDSAGKKLFSPHVKNMNFKLNPYDKREVHLEGTVEIPGKRPGDERKEDFNMVLRVEHAYVVVSAE
jgi:prepilin-type N-terminal cleavage/methylation domain-containing protein